MTKTELARLVKVARSLGHYRISDRENSFVCPLDYEAKRRERDRTASHRFSVFHVAWELGTTVAAVREAFSRHLDMDECSRVAESVDGRS